MSENLQQQSFRFPYGRVSGIPHEELTALRSRYRQLLKDLRAKLECTQTALAESIGVSKGYLNMVENRAGSCNIHHAEAVVRKAYEQYNLPLPSDMPTLPPAEIKGEPLASRIALPQDHSRPAVARAFESFVSEFNVSINEVYALAKVSKGQGYLMRYNRPGPSLKLRRRAITALAEEAERRRKAAAPTSGAPAVIAPPVAPPAEVEVTPTAPTPAAPRPAARQAPKTDVVIPAVLVQSLAALPEALEYDFRTKHRFQKLPDGSILVARES